MNPLIYDQVKSRIIKIHNQNVILDSDVAELYGVETKRINEAVKRNPKKFPDEYLVNLIYDEWIPLKSQIEASILKGGKVKLPTAFTERGLYMLATILKSPKAIKTTIAIIDTFAQIKDLAGSIYKFSQAKTDGEKVVIFENAAEVIPIY
jgi:prophage antirepressor-like protein